MTSIGQEPLETYTVEGGRPMPLGDFSVSDPDLDEFESLLNVIVNITGHDLTLHQINGVYFEQGMKFSKSCHQHFVLFWNLGFGDGEKYQQFKMQGDPLSISEALSTLHLHPDDSLCGNQHTISVFVSDVEEPDLLHQFLVEFPVNVTCSSNFSWIFVCFVQSSQQNK